MEEATEDDDDAGLDDEQDDWILGEDQLRSTAPSVERSVRSCHSETGCRLPESRLAVVLGLYLMQ